MSEKGKIDPGGNSAACSCVAKAHHDDVKLNAGETGDLPRHSTFRPGIFHYMTRPHSGQLCIHFPVLTRYRGGNSTNFGNTEAMRSRIHDQNYRSRSWYIFSVASRILVQSLQTCTTSVPVAPLSISFPSSSRISTTGSMAVSPLHNRACRRMFMQRWTCLSLQMSSCHPGVAQIWRRLFKHQSWL